MISGIHPSFTRRSDLEYFVNDLDKSYSTQFTEEIQIIGDLIRIWKILINLDRKDRLQMTLYERRQTFRTKNAVKAMFVGCVVFEKNYILLH